MADHAIIIKTGFPFTHQQGRLCPGAALLFPDPIPTSSGVDFDAAGELGVKVIWALSIPGKVAPVTAGLAIRDTVYNILMELGV